MNRNATSKGPGRATRKGLSVPQVIRMFPDDATAEAWFAAQRWPDGPVCPHCGTTRVQSGAAHKTMPYRCRERECRKRFSVKTDTVMANSKLGYQVWAIATYLRTTGIKGVSSMRLHRDLGISQKSAWHLAHRIRETWGETLPAFTGPVEADETFVGGKEANKHGRQEAVRGRRHGRENPRRRRERLRDRPRERGGRPQHDRPHAANLRARADAPRRAGLHRRSRGLPYHEAVKHSVHEWVNGQAHTKGLESFWALLKHGHHGVYHKMSPKHLHRYVREFEGRHNQRTLDTIDQMRRMVRGLEGKQFTGADLAA